MPEREMKRIQQSPGLMLLANVPNGADVLVETGRDTNGDSPNWSDPFRDTLYIARHNGVPCGLALNGKGFAEFDPRRDSEGEVGDVEFHSEDYILRILEINGVKVADSANCAAKQVAMHEEVASIAASALINRVRC